MLSLSAFSYVWVAKSNYTPFTSSDYPLLTDLMFPTSGPTTTAIFNDYVPWFRSVFHFYSGVEDAGDYKVPRKGTFILFRHYFNNHWEFCKIFTAPSTLLPIL